MRIVAQRVSSADVKIDGELAGSTGYGLCLLVGVAPGDTEREVSWVADKIVNLRIFDDESGRMNRSLLDVGGSMLIISQFTLYADCRKGRRPSFISAAAPLHGNAMYELLVQYVRERGVAVQTGIFGADMSVRIINEGPVTIILDTDDISK
ncbi:MAG: D-tyrosyl-tRNA(Tyr) deacylase [Synergistaceae bacterium]|jgi:D-tyrosyl-tRNA(Tyr) deacylase|nr:D-tyrosyl-tRNA(Tyr) deacylase [Synergistaceae bacterium]